MSGNFLRSLVECPVCYEVPREARIYICINGHSICGSCKEKVDTCPQGFCSYPDPLIRNRMVESILDSSATGIEVACRNKSLGCTFEGPSTESKKHEPDCMFRSIECPLQCHTEIKALDLYDHMESICKFRAVTCSNQGCSQRMKASAASTHAMLCAFRMVPCPNSPACDVIIRADRRQRHLDSDCKAKTVACKNGGCRFRINYVDDGFSTTAKMDEVKKTHEEGCNLRTVKCKHGRCPKRAKVGGILAHEASCSFRLVKCSHVGCSATHTTNEINAHEATCSHRLFGCSNDGCKIQRTASEIKQHKARCQFSPVSCRHKGCQTKAKASDIQEHEYSCDFRLVRCRHEGCKNIGPYNVVLIHDDVCSLRPVHCKYAHEGCEVKVRADRIKRHEFWCAMWMPMSDVFFTVVLVIWFIMFIINASQEEHIRSHM